MEAWSVNQKITIPDSKTLRSLLGLSQEDFAHEIGVNFSPVNRWENGKMLPSRLAQTRMLEIWKCLIGEKNRTPIH